MQIDMQMGIHDNRVVGRLFCRTSRWADHERQQFIGARIDKEAGPD